MATQTLSTADAILKDLYVGPVIEQLNYKTYMLDKVERDSDSIDHTGRRAIWPLHYRRNRGRGSRADAGQLPTPGRQGWLDAIIPIKFHYYGVEISDASIEATKSNEGAFVKLLDAEVKGMTQDFRKDMNRQVWGLGDGQLTTIRNNEAQNQTVLDVTSVQYIEIGDPVDVLKIDDGTVAGQGLEVTARDATAGANTITVSPGITTAGATASTFAVFVAGSRSNEITGVREVIQSSSRTLHGINSATAGNEFWNAQAISASSATAGESLFEQLADRIGSTGQGEVKEFVTTRGIRRRLADTYQSQKRFNDAKAVNIHGGYTAIFVNEIPVIADDDAPKGYAFGIDPESWRWFQLTDPNWLESDDGTIWHLKPSSTAGKFDSIWTAWFRWYANLGCVAPNQNGMIYGAADDSPS